MNEQDVISKSQKAYQKKDIIKDLKQLGIKLGDCLLVHSSLSKLGWIIGAQRTVVEALLEVVGEEGTLVMPCFSGDNSDPCQWQNPPVPKSWWEDIRQFMPAFDPILTPTREMGKIVDLFRCYPGVKRSYHPQVSFCARGPLTDSLLDNHDLVPGFGENSPLQRLYNMEAKVLLLGVGYGNCTCMHLGEVWQEDRSYQTTGSSIQENGQSKWVEYQEVVHDDSDFDLIGEAYEKEHSTIKGKVGIGTARVLNIQSVSDFAFEWMKLNRKKGMDN